MDQMRTECAAQCVPAVCTLCSKSQVCVAMRPRRSARRCALQGMVTCVLGANVILYLCFLHGDKVAGSAADGKHPLLLVHVERHVAYKLNIEFRLKPTYVATKAREKEGGEKSETGLEICAAQLHSGLVCVFSLSKGTASGKASACWGCLRSGYGAKQIRCQYNITISYML